MEPLETSLPIQICEPRCFVIEPTINRDQAVTHAGARAQRTFGIRRLFGKGQVNTRLLERRIVPFWHVCCKSHFHYDRMTTYKISPEHDDAVEISILDSEDRQIVFPTSEGKAVDLQGIERCVTDRNVSELIDAYAVPQPSSALTIPVFRNDQGQLRQYLAHPTSQVDDLVTLYQEATLDGKPLYDDLHEDEKIEVLLPNEPANRVVGEVMKKVMVSIDPVAIHDWLLTVETVDLYLRPLYVFQFERIKDGDVVQRKVEQLDALQPCWTTLPTTEVPTRHVPWDKILLLSIDASAVVLQELGGPWLRVTSGLLEVGQEHIPDLVEGMKEQNHQKASNFDERPGRHSQ